MFTVLHSWEEILITPASCPCSPLVEQAIEHYQKSTDILMRIKMRMDIPETSLGDQCLDPEFSQIREEMETEKEALTQSIQNVNIIKPLMSAAQISRITQTRDALASMHTNILAMQKDYFVQLSEKIYGTLIEARRRTEVFSTVQAHEHGQGTSHLLDFDGSRYAHILRMNPSSQAFLTDKNHAERLQAKFSELHSRLAPHLDPFVDQLPQGSKAKALRNEWLGQPDPTEADLTGRNTLDHYLLQQGAQFQGTIPTHTAEHWAQWPSVLDNYHP
ncbi:hypothetical protein IAU59_006309 [Kwoniella sp. CBS 9459]